MSEEAWNETPETERPGPCAECKRLRTQGQAAGILQDWPWLGKVRAAQRKHRREEHGQDVAGPQTAEALHVRRPPLAS